MLSALLVANHVILLVSLGCLWVMGLPITWIVFQYLRRRRDALAAEARLLAAPLPPEGALPHVLVQIPAFNEGQLVCRVCEAVANFDWPSDRLHVQVLDDSTDASMLVADEAVSALRERGIDAVLLHRNTRSGYKAGALAAGLEHVNYEYIAILDVDYVPPRNFLSACMRPMLRDSRLALVQARCDYLNAQQNWLTRVQQRILDAHFGIEQAARSWTGQVLPFNGTGGIWRRSAIDDAGGWHSDTLAEDLDLSYRVQLRGWRALFLVTIAVPGELPDDFTTWQMQQFRWTKGPAQVARKLLFTLWRSSVSLPRKLYSTLQFFCSASAPIIGVAAATAAIEFAWGVGLSPLEKGLIALGSLQGMCTVSVFILLGQRWVRGARSLTEVRWLPPLIVLFQCLALANLRGVIEAMLGRPSAFVRTRKSFRAGDPPMPRGGDMRIDTAPSLPNHSAETRNLRA